LHRCGSPARSGIPQGSPLGALFFAEWMLLTNVRKGKFMAGKYTPLENYLRDLPLSQREVTLGFKQIERILNDKLPSSAYEDRRWWEKEKEGNHVNARAWSNAGWKVDEVNFNKKRVKFVRVVIARSPLSTVYWQGGEFKVKRNY
jgi:hypothetical protein